MQRKKNPSAFIRNTYSILQRIDLAHIISWDQQGKGFIIHDLIQFQNYILPQYFKHQKYTSFVRQLNMYGFHKHRHPLTENYFQHDSFHKGQNLTQIKRKPQKKKKYQEEKKFQKQSYSSIAQHPCENTKNQIQQQQIASSLVENPEADNSKSIIDKELMSEEYYDDANNNRESLSLLCEQAILQNQILTKIQPSLLAAGLSLRKLRVEQSITNNPYLLENDEDPKYMSAFQTIASLCQLVKGETMKLCSVLDSLNS